MYSALFRDGRLPRGKVKNPIDWGSGTQLQQLRQYGPICGPPRFPLSMGTKLILGVLPIALMMVIPVWSLFSIRRWSATMRGLPFEG